ncbi:MAG: DinB family protein [Gemmatimonadota bacterium]
MKSSVAQCTHLLSLASAVLADLDDGHLAIEPQPGTKTAGWIIGHLAVTGDFGRRLCGKPPMCPKEWRGKFNPGSQPSLQEGDYPRMVELCTAFREVYRDLSAAALDTQTEQLASENPYAPARDAFPTAGDFVSYLLAGHLAYHLGQLVAWRAAAGFGRLTRPDTLAA